MTLGRFERAAEALWLAAERRTALRPETTSGAPFGNLEAVSDPARDLESKVLGLPPKERARLAERLLASLEGDREPDAEALWVEEAERRLAELESGSASAVPAAEVFRKSRSQLR